MTIENSGKTFSHKGPIQYRGPHSVEELLKGGLEKDQLYYIQVEAWADSQMKKKFSHKWQIGMQIIA